MIYVKTKAECKVGVAVLRVLAVARLAEVGRIFYGTINLITQLVFQESHPSFQHQS